MKTMAISTFKAQALRAVSEVSETKESLRITKRGKPIADVVPYRPKSSSCEPGRLSQFLVHEGDIVSPLGEGIWEASR